MNQEAKIKVSVISGCYTGESGIVMGAVYIPDLQQNMYTIQTSTNGLIHCPENELKIES